MHRYRDPVQLIGFLSSIKRFGIHLRRQSHSKADFCIEELKKRRVIRISGEDSSDFLQGLITNDLSSLTSSMYTMFLNNKGRVLFDSIVYRCKERDTIMLECDSEALGSMIKHLNIYKLRRKVDISSLDSELDIWCAYNPKYIDAAVNKSSKEEIKSDVEPFETSNGFTDGTLVVPDPRTSLLGFRLLVRKGEKVPNLPKSDLYESCRYKLGIGEGVDELLIGQSFPLEMNCDYLQGVSFSKGCYIGQELTARTFHTGVVRKRLMPLQFDSEPLGIPVNSPIEDAMITRKSPIGKLRAAKGLNGLGLLRVAETLESMSLKMINFTARSYLPVWWPDESVQKSYVKIKN